jgi:hypothetical protein
MAKHSKIVNNFIGIFLRPNAFRKQMERHTFVFFPNGMIHTTVGFLLVSYGRRMLFESNGIPSIGLSHDGLTSTMVRHVIGILWRLNAF